MGGHGRTYFLIHYTVEWFSINTETLVMENHHQSGKPVWSSTGYCDREGHVMAGKFHICHFFNYFIQNKVQYSAIFPYLSFHNFNVFQSRAHLLFTDRKSNTYNFTLEWPWPSFSPWPWACRNKLNWCPGSEISIFNFMTLVLTQWHWSWPRYGQDVPPYQNTNCLAQADKQTDTHTQRCTHKHTDVLSWIPIIFHFGKNSSRRLHSCQRKFQVNC